MMLVLTNLREKIEFVAADSCKLYILKLLNATCSLLVHYIIVEHDLCILPFVTLVVVTDHLVLQKSVNYMYCTSSDLSSAVIPVSTCM